ncbi:MAG: YbaB/EbfC family nucleoid-associated protein [Oscillospiraceae bacterium]|nr:YbaB/EbfC family nucleoid-associated protein [Oscillospiraceae bacterium]
MKARLPEGYGRSRGDMMKSLQKMQEDMANMQAELAEREYAGSAGGGMASAVVKGDFSVLRVDFKPEVVDPDDAQLLGDLAAAAVNEAIRLAREDSAAEMDKITGGMDLGGLV